MTWWWLSFADPDAAEGHQFLGCAVVGPATDVVGAAALAHARGCNPGGELIGHELRAAELAVVRDHERHRLLTRAEAEAIGKRAIGRRIVS